MEKERVVFVDYVRVVACFLVMLVHASENFYGADSSGLAGNVSMLANETNRFWVAFWDGGIARTCVPLFIIISSFLLVPLSPQTGMMDFYKRRFKRILPPMFFFMILSCFLPILWGATSVEQAWIDFKRVPLNFPSQAGHLWFMYPLISLYLFIPIVSPWLERASAKDERLFLAIFGISTFIPWLRRFVTPELFGECFWNGFSALWYCSGYLGYLVLAHYIRTHLDWDNAKKMKVGAICFLAGAVFTWWSFYMKGVPGQLIETPMLEWSWEFCTPNVLVATFGAFLMFTCIGQDKSCKFITKLSKLTFGMYLVHLFWLGNIAKWIIGGDVTNPLLPVGLAIPAIAIATYICSALTIKLISFIPGSKWIVGV